MCTFKVGDVVKIISCIGEETKTSVFDIHYTGEITEQKEHKVRLDDKKGGWVDNIDITLATNDEEISYIRYFNGTNSPMFKIQVERAKNQKNSNTKASDKNEKYNKLSDEWETDEDVLALQLLIPTDNDLGLSFYVATKDFLWHRIDPYWLEMSKEDWYTEAKENIAAHEEVEANETV